MRQFEVFALAAPQYAPRVRPTKSQQIQHRRVDKRGVIRRPEFNLAHDPNFLFYFMAQAAGAAFGFAAPAGRRRKFRLQLAKLRACALSRDSLSLRSRIKIRRIAQGETNRPPAG